MKKSFFPSSRSFHSRSSSNGSSNSNSSRNGFSQNDSSLANRIQVLEPDDLPLNGGRNNMNFNRKFNTNRDFSQINTQEMETNMNKFESSLASSSKRLNEINQTVKDKFGKNNNHSISDKNRQQNRDHNESTDHHENRNDNRNEKREGEFNESRIPNMENMKSGLQSLVANMTSTVQQISGIKSGLNEIANSKKIDQGKKHIGVVQTLTRIKTHCLHHFLLDSESLSIIDHFDSQNKDLFCNILQEKEFQDFFSLEKEKEKENCTFVIEDMDLTLNTITNPNSNNNNFIYILGKFVYKENNEKDFFDKKYKNEKNQIQEKNDINVYYLLKWHPLKKTLKNYKLDQLSKPSSSASSFKIIVVDETKFCIVENHKEAEKCFRASIRIVELKNKTHKVDNDYENENENVTKYTVKTLASNLLKSFTIVESIKFIAEKQLFVLAGHKYKLNNSNSNSNSNSNVNSKCVNDENKMQIFVQVLNMDLQPVVSEFLFPAKWIKFITDFNINNEYQKIETEKNQELNKTDESNKKEEQTRVAITVYAEDKLITVDNFQDETKLVLNDVKQEKNEKNETNKTNEKEKEKEKLFYILREHGSDLIKKNENFKDEIICLIDVFCTTEIIVLQNFIFVGAQDFELNPLLLKIDTSFKPCKIEKFYLPVKEGGKINKIIHFSQENKLNNFVITGFSPATLKSFLFTF